jgi:tRNA dimethylallyltransferase
MTDNQKSIIHNLPLVVIVGPTASGKTSLSIDLAKKFNGEIICADSRTIYKYMDIGTAKPTTAERFIVPHWGLDLVEPGQKFSAADFKKYADSKIIEIRSRGHIPFLVGGSGLYVDAVILDYSFGNTANDDFRTMLNSMTIDQLHTYCNKYNIPLPENYKNKRYVIHAIENIKNTTTRRGNPLENTIVVGIATEKVILRARIKQRSEQLFKDGVVDEAIMLGDKYGWNNEAMTSNIYRVINDYQQGLISKSDMAINFETLDWRLAKRQLTWFRRNKFIQWLPLDEANKYISSRIAIYK